MKLFFSIISILTFSVFFQAQLTLSEISSTKKFDKQVEEFNNGASKIKYSEVKGTPYYYPEFLVAKVADTNNTAFVRYNSFLDLVEVVEKEDVYQLTKDETSPDFTFEKTKEKLVFVKTDDFYSGYFIEITAGKYRILKKVMTKFQPETAAPNSMIAGTPALFIPQKPLYFIKTEKDFVKITNAKDLAKSFPEKGIDQFISKNKIKLNREEDLIKLGIFLNQ